MISIGISITIIGSVRYRTVGFGNVNCLGPEIGAVLIYIGRSYTCLEIDSGLPGGIAELQIEGTGGFAFERSYPDTVVTGIDRDVGYGRFNLKIRLDKARESIRMEIIVRNGLYCFPGRTSVGPEECYCRRVGGDGRTKTAGTRRCEGT